MTSKGAFDPLPIPRAAGPEIEQGGALLMERGGLGRGIGIDFFPFLVQGLFCPAQSTE